MKPQRRTWYQNDSQASRGEYSSQMHSSHHCGEEMKIRGKAYQVWSARQQQRQEGAIYLQPCSLSRRAYIFPMSPSPMMPIEKLDMSCAPVVTVVGAIFDLYSGRRICEQHVFLHLSRWIFEWPCNCRSDALVNIRRWWFLWMSVCRRWSSENFRRNNVEVPR